MVFYLIGNATQDLVERERRVADQDCNQLDTQEDIRLASLSIGHGDLRLDGNEFEFSIIVSAKVQVQNPLLCAEMVPYAASWVRMYPTPPQDGQVRIFDSREHQGTEQWAYNQALGGPNAGRYLHFDWPCEIYYKREFPCIDRSQPDFEDPQDIFNSYDSPEEASNLVVAELHNHDIVLSDRPSSTVDPGCYIKYEFQSAYLLRDPRPTRRDTTIGYRRFVTFVFGTVDHLEMTSVRPGDWEAPPF